MGRGLWSPPANSYKVLCMRFTILTAALFVAMFHATDGDAVQGVIEGRVLNEQERAEAGVWVIAETADLPTEFRKIVVTDKNGRFVLPELPAAHYEVWVRGYGLLDSDRHGARPGDTLDLKVAAATDPAAAAVIYPANYWLALLEIPNSRRFGEASAPYRSQAAWRSQFKLNCMLCHQLGSAATRLPNASAFDHGLKKAAAMNFFADRLGREQLLGVLADWGDRIARGETPSAPPRPTGIERHFVITQWGWGDRYTYAHDEIATDKRNPFLYPNGPIYGADIGNDHLLMLDPVSHTASRITVPTRDGFDTPWCDQTYKASNDDEVVPFGVRVLGCPWPGGASGHLGQYQNAANPHNPMMDGQGRVWMTTQIRRQWAEDLPEFCKHSSIITDNLHHRQLGYYDTNTRRFVLVDTCFGTHHLQFDPNGMLWVSGDDYVIGWLDTAIFDASDPASLERAQGFSQVRVDSNGDGTADQPLVGFHYGIIPSPIDGAVWTAVPPGISSPSGEPGRIHRFDRKADRHEAYSPPTPGYGPRGVDLDSKGVVWTALAGSGHLARFDRSRCRQHWGTGAQCPEGWTLWETPGLQFKGVRAMANDGGTDMHYYLWVDQFDTLGMGRDAVVINGTGSDSLVVFDPKTKKFTVIRVPYPLNTYTRGLDGRIDDPDAGWKGRGLWFTNGLDPIIHSEIPKSYVGKVQLRPHPLAH